MLQAFDPIGNEVKIGDTIEDFHGDRATLRGISRARSYGKAGKVVVQWQALSGMKGQPGSFYYDDNRQTRYEYNDSVFDLEVKEVDSNETV